MQEGTGRTGKVTLRMNANVTFAIKDARRAVNASSDVRHSLYREVQLALRAVIGGRELDSFLTGKDDVAQELEQQVREQATVLGLEVSSVGIKDVILPGDMKDLMNKVTEDKKAAEANLIARREETTAMRSQANTATLLADNPMVPTQFISGKAGEVFRCPMVADTKITSVFAPQKHAFTPKLCATRIVA